MGIQNYEYGLSNSLARNWWALGLRGLAALVFGVIAILVPAAAVAVLVILFGAYALVDGIFALVAAFRTQGNRRWALILEGIAGVVAGAVTLCWPGIAAISLLYIIAAWAIITGVAEIAAAIRLRKEIEGEWLLMLGGALSIIFGVVAMLQPGAGLLAITWMIALYAILFGIVLIMLALKLRTRGQQLKTTAP